ncbi:MAG: hypothetical protein IKU26_07550 [Clostridia bacterium]|nr:hypothetical protein [Clostridia bacterium]
MKRVISLFLTVVMCVALCLPCTVNGADEYSKLTKSTYAYGEYMEIAYKFSDADPTRWVCVYKNSVSVSNMVFVYPATVFAISGYFIPQLGIPVNGYQVSNAFEPGNYVMKVMYIPEGGNYADANNFSTGAKSDLTYSFTVTANSVTKPTLSIANRQIQKNGNLTVAYSGLSYDLGSRSLNLVVTNQSGKTVKTRALFNANYYAGISGEATIALTGLAAGTYKVGFVCDDATFVIDQAPIEITVTDEVASGTDGVFPKDLFKNKETTGRYFTNADNAGNVYSTVNGEYVLSIPHHLGYEYMYTWEPMPYDTFTVTFDFLIHIQEDYDSQIADEMDFLFGVSEDGKIHHQLTIANTAEAMSVNHWLRDENGMSNYTDDSYFYDLYEEEAWNTVAVQITGENATVFLNGEEIITLTDTANCTGEFGRIGLRGGSSGGWDIKNLKVYEGLYKEETATEAPTEAPTETPAATQTPATTQAPTQAPTEQTNGGNGALIIVVIAIVVVAACAVVTVIILTKKKK